MLFAGSLDLINEKLNPNRMQKNLRIAVIIVFLLSQFVLSYAQSTFVRRAGSSSGDYGVSCNPTADGGTILVMPSSTIGIDLYSALIKFDNIGNVQWSTKYRVGEYTDPYTVLPAKDNGYIVLGMSLDRALINYNHYFISLYKTDDLGITQWNKQFSFSPSDMPLNLVYRKAGGYISFSQGDYNTGTYPSMVVTAYHDNGNIIWSKKYFQGYGLRGSKGIEMPNHNICFVGTVGDPVNTTFLDVVVTMLDPLGNILWCKTFGTFYDDEPYAIAVNSSNEIFITGRNYIMGREWDSFLIKLDSLGNKTGSMVYDGGTNNGEIMRCILAFDDGSCKLLGDMGTFDERDIVMLNIDSNLLISSACRYSFSPMYTNYPYDLYKTSDGGIIFTGDYRPPAAFRDAILTKTESDGTLPCFMSHPVFTEHNEVFSDTIQSITTHVVSVTTLNFPDTIPVVTFLSNVVCALTAEVPEPEISSPSIFPNPVTDVLFIEITDGIQINSVSLINMEGKIVFEKIISKHENFLRINMIDLPAGLYTLKYLMDTKVRVEKIVKN